MSYSQLIWDNVSNLPFPDSVKPLLQGIDWSDFQWICYNLPRGGAVFNMMDGKTLYQNNAPDGAIKIEKMTVTGEIVFGHFFINPDVNGENVFCSFRAVIVDGELRSIKLENEVRSPAKEFYDSQAKLLKDQKMRKSFLFKWMYRPYSFLIRSVIKTIVFVLECIAWVLVTIAEFLTPF